MRSMVWESKEGLEVENETGTKNPNTNDIDDKQNQFV